MTEEADNEGVLPGNVLSPSQLQPEWRVGSQKIMQRVHAVRRKLREH